ncbi:MAG: hypothetical protein PG981_000769 [Wolbachia endosymbiont of Ctenocephalides orientis wCori]|nr:MAG: hypothetical protein PG981_000769 [Wolbachia endosymbiont of Ctenocephalides orientis wCori]
MLFTRYKLLPGLAKISDVNLLKELLADNQYVVKSRDSNGDTLLSLAIKNNCDDKILKELLKSGVDPYSVNDDGLTALGLLAQNNGSNLGQAKILVEAMEKVARRDASKRLELKSIIETKSNGSQIESKKLLERALVDGKDDIAGLLIIAGARKGINIKDDQGKDIFDRSFNNNSISEFWHGDVFINPLIDRATGEKDLFIIKRLLKHERTKNLIIEKVRGNDDLVTKTIKGQSDSNNQFLEFLINNDLLSANAKIHGKPLLQLACEANNLSAAKLLIGLGADISTKIEHGYTSLDYVLGKEKEEFFKLFTDKIEGYEKSKKVELLSSAMLHAVQNQNQKVFDKWFQLLQCSASVTYQNSDGDNLMHIAQKVGRGDCMLDKLLQHRLPNATCKNLALALSAKNKEGKTPIEIINNKPQLSS